MRRPQDSQPDPRRSFTAPVASTASQYDRSSQNTESAQNAVVIPRDEYYSIMRRLNALEQWKKQQEEGEEDDDDDDDDEEE